MHPVLFHIFRFPIHSYGFMLAVSFLLGIWLATYRAKKSNLDPDAITDVGFYVILAAIAGSRLYYVFLHFDSFRGNLWRIINPFQEGSVGIGGLVMYGGLIGAIIAGVIYFRVKKYPFLPYADAVAPSLGLGIFLTRIGCFLNGCCYGAPSDGPLAVAFPAESPAGRFQQIAQVSGLHPAQLYLSAGGLIICLVVLWAGRKKLFDGFLFYLTGLLYSVLRFGVDFVRHYEPSEKLGGLSHNQFVCIALFAVFGGLVLKQLVFKEETPGPPRASTPGAG
jgi:phosphatidylglycerol:prolipoprotein diacylglycerol transferase